MKVCPQCESEFEDIYSFCLKDGTALQTPEESNNLDDEQKTVSRQANTEKPIGAETVVMDEKPSIGDETMVMDESHSIGEETVVMDEKPSIENIPRETDEKLSIGDKTAVMDEKPTIEDTAPPVTDEKSSIGNETAVMDKEALTQEELDSIQKETQQQTDPPNEEWQNQEETNTEIRQVIAIPTSDTEEEKSESAEQQTFVAQQVPINQEVTSDQVPKQTDQKEKSKSYLGLILGVLGVFLLLFIGVVAGGVYLYFQNQDPSSEIATANSNQEANTNSNVSNENSDLGEINLENPNENSDKTNENTALESNSSTENSNKKDEEKPTPTKETKTPTPKPTPTRTVTPIPTPTKTPTPRPTSTPRPTRTPPPTPRVPKRIAGGVVNGKAISLPKPAYPAAARAANIKGAVSVAVVIAKNGRVISAAATRGHPLLRRAAVQAARRARFRPTLLSGQPVEVSGVIVYNFQ